MTGEWKGASKRSTGTLLRGIAVLLLAIVVLGLGNYRSKLNEMDLEKNAFRDVPSSTDVVSPS